jgi:hypothetical protein
MLRCLLPLLFAQCLQDGTLTTSGAAACVAAKLLSCVLYSAAAVLRYCVLQDGKLTTEELLRALVLDGAVAEDAVDADVYAVFDK